MALSCIFSTDNNDPDCAVDVLRLPCGVPLD